jgi:hypothetical protein
VFSFDLGYECFALAFAMALALALAMNEQAKSVCSLKIDSGPCSSVQESHYEFMM